MTEESTKNKIILSLEEGGPTEMTINGEKVAVISPEGNVLTFKSAQLAQPDATAGVTAGDIPIAVGAAFNSVATHGAKVTLTDGKLLVATEGFVTIEPAPANDTAIAAALASDTAAAQVALTLGQQTADGVFAGLTADGKQQIFAMPKDLDVKATFNYAAAAVKNLNAENAFEHNDWHIPSLENLNILQKNQNEGALKGTFNTTNKKSLWDSFYPGWYWSSTVQPSNSSNVRDVRFSDGKERGNHVDLNRLSCRPIRLVPVAGSSLG